MRNLLRFILKNHFIVLFIILEFLSLTFIVNNNSFQRSVFNNTFRSIKGNVYSVFDNFRHYMSLREANHQLIQENLELRNLLRNDYNTSLVEFINIDSSYFPHYRFFKARVINNSANKQHNFITLNKGSIHGVEPDMGVISANGVVGIVEDVSSHFSSVISLLNTNLNISSKIKKNNAFGPLTWNGINYRTVILKEIPYHVKITPGDSIVTSGFSSVFPEGIFIGIISDFSVKGGNFYEIEVDLANDFKSLSNVYLVQNFLKEEQNILEEVTTND
jgi:rod shape-determining protein MreC